MPGVDWPARKAGLYYGPAVPEFTRCDSTGLNENVIAFAPFFCPAVESFDRIAFFNYSTSQGGTRVRLGIYSDEGGYPANLVLDAGEVTLTMAAAVRAITIAQTLTRGLWWLAFLTDVSVNVRVLSGRQVGDASSPAASTGPLPWAPREFSAWGSGLIGAAQAARVPQAYGALPAVAGANVFQAVTADVYCPDLMLRKAA